MSRPIIVRRSGGIVLFSIVWVGTFLLTHETLYYLVAGTAAAIVGTICFLIVYRTWHPHPVIKPLIVVAIITLSKVVPYAYSDTLLERATSCADHDIQLFGWSVASTDFAHERPGPSGHVVSVKHEKCYDFLAGAIPSFYFVFVHRAGERDNDANLVLRYRSCLDRPPTVTWGNSALLISTGAGGDRYGRQDKRQVTQCAAYSIKVPIITRQRSGIDGIPIRYYWAGSPPYYDLETVPERVVRDHKFSLQNCKIVC
jgi:hypothetical protein